MTTQVVKRNISGILLLDKPKGVTSNRALQQMKRLFQAKKAGHTGSLDPLATGMLPICFGQATKFSEYLLTADKTYVVTAQLGVKTTTADAEGEVISQSEVPDLTVSQLDRLCDAFRGVIQQVPSMYSALKHNGKPLYEYARAGITIERPARTVTIYELVLLDYDASLSQLTCRVRCSKGTYIRNLMEDLGDAVGCGAHVSELRRLSVGGFAAEQMHTTDTLIELCDQRGVTALDQKIQPVATAAASLPIIKIDQVRYLNLLHGKVVPVFCGADIQGAVQVHSKHGEFWGVAEVVDGTLLKPVRILK